MAMIEKSIFRQYDIRGIVGKDLTEENVELLGKAIGSYIKTKDIVIARDNRFSSVPFRNAMIRGLNSTGINVIDIGLAPSPVLYFALRHLKIPSGIMITGSHNPKEYNGFKILANYHCIYGNEIQEISRIIEKNEFRKGEGNVRVIDVLENYIVWIKQHINLKRRVKVVVDCGNGTAGVVAPRILKELGCEVIELFCESDGSFPNHHPDPTQPELYKELAETVKNEKADLGVAYDGDGDRIGVVDETGKMVFGDQMMILFSREILKKNPGARIGIEVKCSQSLIDDVMAHGGVPVMSPTGHSIIEALMERENLVLTGEMSGHIFFADEYFGYDDAIYASARLLRLLSGSEKSVGQMLAEAPGYFSTPEIRLHCSDEKKFEVVGKLTEAFKSKYNVIDIDGARVVFDDGWGLIRASNTQPVLVLRFEAKSQERLEEIQDLFRKALSAFPEISSNWDSNKP